MFAAEKHIPVKPFPADWDRHQKAAGRIRNKEMAYYADALVAITYGTSGTWNMVQQMRILNKPYFVYDLRAQSGAQTPTRPLAEQSGRTIEPDRELRSPTIDCWEAGAYRGKPSALNG